MKKLVSLVLCMVLCLTLCTSALAENEPLHITFWHNRGAGAQHEVVKASVDDFNEGIGKEKGIFVDEVFVGGYGDLYTKIGLANQAGDAPTVMVIGCVRVGMLMDDDLIVDMAPYAEATGFDTSNLADCFMEVFGNTDGHLYSIPYIRSAPVFYYNKTIADQMGLTPPETIEEMKEFCKAQTVVKENGEVERWGFELYNSFTFLQACFLLQKGQPLLDENGESPAVEGGAMLEFLSDWKSWVDEGWCRPFDSTNAGSILTEMFFQGKVAAFVDSCANMSNYTKFMKEPGYELGVAPYPTYDKNNKAVTLGGGNLVLVDCGNSEEQKQAGWEFLQYLMTDERVAKEAIGSGYLPVTKSVSDSELMKAYWEENPNFKVAYDELIEYGTCQEMPFVLYRNEYGANCESACSLLIQEGSITPEEAVKMIRENAAYLKL